MIERKPLLGFLGITFSVSWTLFLLPLALQGLTPTSYQLARQILWAAAMWGPGIAAIVATAAIARQPLRTLNLGRLGQLRYYFWALILPLLLSIAAGLFTVLFGLARFDGGLSLLTFSMASFPETAAVDPWLIAGLQAILIFAFAPFINILFTLGEELGWRGFLLPRLMPLGRWRAILISGLVWGFWHAPAVLQGLNYPENPILGVPLMMVFCVLLGTILSWLYMKTSSPWAPALAHGAINAVAGLPILFLVPGFNQTFGGSLASMAGWIGLVMVVLFLVIGNKFPAGR